MYVNKKEDISGKELILLFATLLTVMIGYFTFNFFSNVYVEDTGNYVWNVHPGYTFLRVIYQIVSFAAILIAVIIYQRIKEKQREENMNLLLAEQIENTKQHISEVEKLYGDIRALKHDVGNHITVLENLYLKKETTEIEKYLAELKSAWSESVAEIKTGNPVTDVILTQKQKEAEEKGIDFRCKFMYPTDTGINAFDVSVILNNAITNAFEGVSGCKNPYVSISAYRKKNAYMSEINSFSDYASKYNTNVDYSYLFGGMQTPSTGSAFNLSDYAAIKNGSYGKLLKAYYAKQDAEKASSGGDTVQKSTLMKSGADVLKKSADALNNDELWEKKKIKKKDEKTGEEIEVEDYDWEAITKAVKSFVEDYNDVVEQAGDSNSKDVLRNAVWMTGITESNENMLSKIGITVGKGNKLELDEEALKKADISSFKTLFTGHNSFADKVSMKANSISNAAARTSGTYKSNGTYNNALSELVSKKVDEEV